MGEPAGPGENWLKARVKHYASVVGYELRPSRHALRLPGKAAIGNAQVAQQFKGSLRILPIHPCDAFSASERLLTGL